MEQVSGLGNENVSYQLRAVFNGVPVYYLCRIYELCQKNFLGFADSSVN
jgi:hypothetical protein